MRRNRKTSGIFTIRSRPAWEYRRHFRVAVDISPSSTMRWRKWSIREEREYVKYAETVCGEDNVVVIVSLPQKSVVDSSLVSSREFRPILLRQTRAKRDLPITSRAWSARFDIRKANDGIASDYGNFVWDVLSTATSNFQRRRLYLADSIEISRRLISQWIVFETSANLDRLCPITKMTNDLIFCLSYFLPNSWLFFYKNLMRLPTPFSSNICSDHRNDRSKKLLSRMINTQR